MHRSLPRAALLGTALLLLAACAEPFIVLAGAALTGEVTYPPADWTELAKVDIMQLETRPDDPYSVNIWAVAVGADMYVATGKKGTRWSRHIDDSPQARLRIHDQVFELKAAQVDDAAERRRVSQAYVAKYDLDKDDNWVMDGRIFRLDRR